MAAKAPAAPWRSRITGSGEEDPTQLLANPRNWRIHPGRQREAVRAALDTVGWVQQVLVNQRTGFVVDGHLRVEEAISREEASVPVLYVDLSEEEEALVLATLDPLAAMAGQSDERLRALLAEVQLPEGALADMLTRLGKDYGDRYTGTIKVPRYEPSWEVPPTTDQLYDETKAEELRAAIRAAGLSPEVTRFLEAAAGRHTVFRYSAIAEFYASATPAVQRLMEASALVIVDYEDAIRDGYVKFVEAVAALADEEAPDAYGDD